MSSQEAIKFDGRQRYTTDKQIENDLKDHLQKYGIDALDGINHFSIYARRVHLKKFISHWELFRKTIELPGDIVELGVFRGLSMMSFANFLEITNIGDRTKKVWGFDNWKGFIKLDEKDGKECDQVNKVAGGFNSSGYFEELQDAITLFDNDRFVPWKKRIELIEGNIEQTVPKFIEDNPGLRISLIHFDCDMYEPTKIALECLYDKVVRGGVIVFDEYGVIEWAGESAAVDEFFAGKDIKLQKFPWQGAPGAYIIKP